MLHIPEGEIEPWPCIRRADWLEAIEAFDRTLEPDGGRMQCAYRRKFAIGAFDTDHISVVRGLVQHRHMYGAGVPPQAEQRGMAGGEFARHRAPGVRRDHRARP